MTGDTSLEQALVVPVLPCESRRRWSRWGTWAAVLVLGLVAAAGVGSTPVLCLLGLLGVVGTGMLMTANDFRYALRVERGRVALLRNGVPIFDGSVLAGDGCRILLSEDRIEAVRCRKGELGRPAVRSSFTVADPDDLAPIARRLSAEAAALESLPRQLELIDDPDVQHRLRARLRTEHDGRRSALAAELLLLAEGRSAHAVAAQRLLAEGGVDS